MQTLTRVEPCSCETNPRRRLCPTVTICQRNAAVEAEAREWESLLDEYKERNAMLGAEVERLKAEAEEWARKVEALEAENARMRLGLRAVEELIAESGGVYGLHLNGDPSPWSELLPPGRFGDWLAPYAEALE